MAISTNGISGIFQMQASNTATNTAAIGTYGVSTTERSLNPVMESRVIVNSANAKTIV